MHGQCLFFTNIKQTLFESTRIISDLIKYVISTRCNNPFKKVFIQSSRVGKFNRDAMWAIIGVATEIKFWSPSKLRKTQTRSAKPIYETWHFYAFSGKMSPITFCET